MIERCRRPSHRGYKNYGGRGIKVCARWKRSFSAFLEDMGEASPGLSLERIDNGGNYEPGNCRWATMKDQLRNTRKNLMMTLDGRTQAQSAWAEELDLPKSTIRMRLKIGWSVRDALLTPPTIKRERGPRKAVAISDTATPVSRSVAPKTGKSARKRSARK